MYYQNNNCYLIIDINYNIIYGLIHTKKKHIHFNDI